MTWGVWSHEVSDPDNSDTHTFTWDCGLNTRFFRMSKLTGVVTYSVTFDYDTADVTSPFDCVVTVTDNGGLSATTTLEIDIKVGLRTVSTNHESFSLV